MKVVPSLGGRVGCPVCDEGGVLDARQSLLGHDLEPGQVGGRGFGFEK